MQNMHNFNLVLLVVIVMFAVGVTAVPYFLCIGCYFAAPSTKFPFMTAHPSLPQTAPATPATTNMPIKYPCFDSRGAAYECTTTAKSTTEQTTTTTIATTSSTP